MFSSPLQQRAVLLAARPLRHMATSKQRKSMAGLHPRFKQQTKKNKKNTTKRKNKKSITTLIAEQERAMEEVYPNFKAKVDQERQKSKAMHEYPPPPPTLSVGKGGATHDFCISFLAKYWTKPSKPALIVLGSKRSEEERSKETSEEEEEEKEANEASEMEESVEVEEAMDMEHDTTPAPNEEGVASKEDDDDEQQMNVEKEESSSDSIPWWQSRSN